ncbi:GNAT family N-acetyltransferase [Natronomonas halophila]|uniref:arsenic resistance N-acetyltransferase ArsN2 n=1 Tax=Natronomonas halophila TaxID=2747817 RepID=UPI0015B4177E|nr:arsenic resistance N-acetyltransferase ArsN2 [Natronomonas halophila]QLD86350.1 GNAT family N-acetyltransferase [Natronomonas halophila]
MLPGSITLTSADAERMGWLEDLLEASGLPTGDLRTSEGRFFVASVGTERVGGGGLEIYGPDALLRSVVVPESKRGQGYGTALCDALEARAQANGVETLYLLTTTAEAFFDAHGYDVIDRETVPPEIRETGEFTDLCPKSATCMRKALDG